MIKIIISILFLIIVLSGVIVYVTLVRRNTILEDENSKIVKVWGISPLNFLVFMCCILLILEFISSFPFLDYMKNRDKRIEYLSSQVDSLQHLCDESKSKMVNFEKTLDNLNKEIDKIKLDNKPSITRVHINNGSYNPSVGKNNNPTD